MVSPPLPWGAHSTLSFSNEIYLTLVQFQSIYPCPIASCLGK